MAPPIIIRWVGPHSVTSWPKMRCQMSSSGKPIIAYIPQAAISNPPTGACQLRVMRTDAGPGLSNGNTTANMPATKMPNRPMMMK